MIEIILLVLIIAYLIWQHFVIRKEFENVYSSSLYELVEIFYILWWKHKILNQDQFIDIESFLNKNRNNLDYPELKNTSEDEWMNMLVTLKEKANQPDLYPEYANFKDMNEDEWMNTLKKYKALK